MSQVTCSVCRNEDNKMCKVKKVGVHVNKRRECNKYIFDSDRVRPADLVKTIKMPYAEKEEMKRRYKEELKRYREVEKNTKEAGLDPASINMHPLTGDLSRFKSTVSQGE